MPTAVSERRTMSRGIGRGQYSCRSLATSSVSNDGRRERGLASTVSPGALVLAAAIPILFLHVDYQPGGSVGFAALSGAALLVGIVALAVPRLRLGRALAATALASGVLGMIVAGAIASVLGLATALVALGGVLLPRHELVPRRLTAVAAIGAVVLVGAIAIRGSDLDAFSRVLGASPGQQQAAPAKIQTHAHRTLLVWLRFEIWNA